MIPIANPIIGDRERRRVNTVLDEGQLADGPEVRMFERALADRYGAEHGIATSNGTTALHAALVGLGIGAGDTVVTTPFSFIASANAARLAGADVAFVDIDPETYTMDPDALESRLDAGEPVDAIVPVHLFGLPADMSALSALQDDHDFAIVEDAAQAHDAAVRGRPVGTIGDVGCFSFYPTKNVTSAEGGMIVTDQDAVAEGARQFIDHGRTEGYEHATVGHNFRLSSVHAAIGNAQLERIADITEARRQNAATLSDGLADLPVTTPVEPADRHHVYHQYTIRHPDRDRLQEELASRDIESRVYYPIPIHEQPAYDDSNGSYPVAEQAAREVLSLPVHPGLSADDIEHIQLSIAATTGAIA